jgi:hypothetical protein
MSAISAGAIGEVVRLVWPASMAGSLFCLSLFYCDLFLFRTDEEQQKQDGNPGCSNSPAGGASGFWRRPGISLRRLFYHFNGAVLASSVLSLLAEEFFCT